MKKTAEQEALEANIVEAAMIWSERQNVRFQSDIVAKSTCGPNGSKDMVLRYEVTIRARRDELALLESEGALTYLTDRLSRLRAKQADAEGDRAIAGQEDSE